MDKISITLIIINDFLTVLGLDNVDDLKKIPKIEKRLFDNNKVALDKVISKHINKLHEVYKPK